MRRAEAPAAAAAVVVGFREGAGEEQQAFYRQTARGEGHGVEAAPAAEPAEGRERITGAEMEPQPPSQQTQPLPLAGAAGAALAQSDGTENSSAPQEQRSGSNTHLSGKDNDDDDGDGLGEAVTEAAARERDAGGQREVRREPAAAGAGTKATADAGRDEGGIRREGTSGFDQQAGEGGERAGPGKGIRAAATSSV